MSEQLGFSGFASPADSASDHAALLFMMRQVLSRLNTSLPVQVVSCTNSGGVTPVGFVDVQILVNQLDGDGNATPRGIVHNLPYQRIQGGRNAIIMDPEKGDIGTAVFASRDISSVKATKGQANPGSNRRFNMADGVYLGGFLNQVPTQYVQLLEGGAGINVVSPTRISLNAPDVQINCQTLETTASTSVIETTPTRTNTGNLLADGEVTARASGGSVSLSTHSHTQNPDSHGDTEEPTNSPTPGT